MVLPSSPTIEIARPRRNSLAARAIAPRCCALPFRDLALGGAPIGPTYTAGAKPGRLTPGKHRTRCWRSHAQCQANLAGGRRFNVAHVAGRAIGGRRRLYPGRSVCELQRKPATRRAKASMNSWILDVGLPDGDGRALCRELREDGAATCPIILLTAKRFRRRYDRRPAIGCQTTTSQSPFASPL